MTTTPAGPGPRRGRTAAGQHPDSAAEQRVLSETAKQVPHMTRKVGRAHAQTVRDTPRVGQRKVTSRCRIPARTATSPGWCVRRPVQLQLPVVGRVPIPRPDQLAFYGAAGRTGGGRTGRLAVVAVAIGAGHALGQRTTALAEKNPPTEKEP